MLNSLFSLSNTLIKILREDRNVYEVDFKNICQETIGKNFYFALYSEISKGFIITFKNSDLPLFKDVIVSEEISRSLNLFDGKYYVDILFFNRRYRKRILIRILVPFQVEGESILKEIIDNYYLFLDLYDKQFIYDEVLNILKETSNVEDIDEVIDRSTSITKRILNTEAASILLKDEKRNELYFKAIDSEESDRIKEVRVPIDKGIAGYVARTSKPLVVNDISKFPDFYKAVDEKSGFLTRSVLATPIKPLNKVVGVFEAINKIDGKEFSIEDLEILNFISEVVGINIVNSLLYKRLDEVMGNVIESLITALEARDEYTKGHSYRVQIFSVKIANAMGLDSKYVKRVAFAAILHDIGKIGVPDNVLRKPEKLTDEEFEIIKKHPVIGYNILKHIDDIEDILDGIKYHHERFDGRGYPEGLKGKNIPLMGRIIAVADTLDAITSDRPYRKGLNFDYALEEIKKVKGTQLDPEIVDIFVNSFNYQEFKNIISRL
ncbi:MAG: HD domain-containing phosphohydrolase [Brevinematia bacterium]